MPQREPLSDKEMEKEWADATVNAADHSERTEWMLAGAGMALLIVSAVLGQLLENTNHPPWLKYILSVIPGMIGAIFLFGVVQEWFTRKGRRDAELLRVKEYAQVLGDILAERVQGQRWCRWLGPVHHVYHRRSETYLGRFFTDAREIDILTPNLCEISQQALDSIKANKHAQVRMMSLHPECSAVYRRYNDMEGMSLEEGGFGSRRGYSKSIRLALTRLQRARESNNLGWEIRTYTAFPVMMIFRADDRFLLGFPLVGKRVREQFHLELILSGNATRDALKGSVFKGMNEDQVLASEVRKDLMTHFEKIWETARPYVDRQRIFQMASAVKLDATAKAISTGIDLPQAETVNDLLRWACSHSQFKEWREAQEKDCRNTPDELDPVLKESVARAHLDPLREEFSLKGVGKDVLAPKIAQALTVVAVAAARVNCLSTIAGVDEWIPALADELSHEIAKNTVEFEDLAEAMFYIRKECVPQNEIQTWKETWLTIERSAEYWAR